jgi:hypothetical protein
MKREGAKEMIRKWGVRLTIVGACKTSFFNRGNSQYMRSAHRAATAVLQNDSSPQSADNLHCFEYPGISGEPRWKTNTPISACPATR